MTHAAKNPCTTCYWSRPFNRDLVCCANEDAIKFRQVCGPIDTCKQWRRKDA